MTLARREQLPEAHDEILSVAPNQLEPLSKNSCKLTKSINIDFLCGGLATFLVCGKKGFSLFGLFCSSVLIVIERLFCSREVQVFPYSIIFKGNG